MVLFDITQKIYIYLHADVTFGTKLEVMKKRDFEPRSHAKFGS